MKRRFPALHVVSAIFKILAWIVLALTVVLAVLAAIKKYAFITYAGSPLVLAGGILLIGLIYFLVLYAAAEGILVVLAIEENTRKETKA